MHEHQEIMSVSLGVLAMVLLGAGAALWGHKMVYFAKRILGKKMSTEERTIKCLAVVTGIPAEQITPGMSRRDLSMDSMDEAELLLFLEDEFNIEIPDEVIERVVTVGGLVSYINLRMAS